MMLKRKKEGIRNSSKIELLAWTPIMDDALVDALLHQHNKGNKVNGTWTSKAYDNIVAKLKVKISEEIDKNKVKNHQKTIKSNFSKCYNLFKNGLSRFAWNSTTKLWSVKPKVWEILFEVRNYFYN